MAMVDVHGALGGGPGAAHGLGHVGGDGRSNGAAPAQVAPPTPPAFPRRSDFAPPPRRMPSTGPGAGASPTPGSGNPPPPPRRQTATPPEESGEWVEAMYDYSSEVRWWFGVLCLLCEMLRWVGAGSGRLGYPGGYADPCSREDFRRLVSTLC